MDWKTTRKLRHRIAVALLAIVSLAGTTGYTELTIQPAAALTAPDPTWMVAYAPSKTAAKAVFYAYAQIGKPYSMQSNLRLGPYAFDCSGLVFSAYIAGGLWLAYGTTPYTQSILRDPHLYRISRSQVRPGDIVYFSFPGHQTNGHMAIALGNNWMIEASSSKGYVKLTNFTNYAQYVSGYYRVFAP